MSVLTLLGTAAFAVGRFVFGQTWPAGFATTAILITLSLSLNALFLGIIGEYLGRIYKQVKHGPNVIIEMAIDSSDTREVDVGVDTRAAPVNVAAQECRH